MATNQQTNTFPLFFTLERVDNGYILKCKEETAGLTHEAQWRKEVVLDDKIDQRIGHLLHLDTMKKELPITFFVEAVTENTYKFEGDDGIKQDDLLQAKLLFYQFQLKNYKDDVVLCLQVGDTIEIYGSNAEKLAISNPDFLIRVGGVHMMRFPNNKDGKKQISTLRPQVTLLSATEEQIVNWYNTHRLDSKTVQKLGK